jgi:ATP-dependent Clp protease protease subunit
MDRIIFLGSEIDDDVANIVIAQLLFLEADSPGKDIQLYINSPGGDVSAGLAIYDTMQHLSSAVCTICMGMAASMGCFLLATGRKGKRSALPHARIMMHQPGGGTTKGTASDIEILAKEILYTRAGESPARQAHRARREQIGDFDRDNYMSAEEAKAYGIIDHVIERRGSWWWRPCLRRTC